MKKRLASETGSALVIAMFAIVLMLMIGLATYSFVDGEQAQAGQEHVRESSFNLTNGALNQQTFQLGRVWADAANPYPSWCTRTSAAGLPCPNADALTSSFTGPEYRAGTCAGGGSNGWRTAVRDNGGGAASFYDPAVVPGQPTYDANKDGAVWVRAEGTARCRQRTLVALVKLAPVTLPFPRNVITANWLSVTNSGRKVIVDTLGRYAQPRSAQQPSNSQPAGVSARCQSPPPGPCPSYDPAKGQISPDTVPTTPAGSANTLTQTQLDGLKALAQQQQPSGFYPAGTCPPSLTGAYVYVEDMTNCGGYRGGNTAASPGVLVFEHGTLSLGGNGVFYGVVYAANKAPSITGAVVSIGGTAGIQGAIVVDGPGGVYAGSSATNVVFDPRAFSLIQTLGNATMVPNTWRQLSNG